MRHKSILVTGSHRSGSTWVGQMIASHAQVVYLWEPFNPVYKLPGSPVRHWFERVTPERAPLFREFLRPLLRFESKWWKEIVERPRPRRMVGATLRAAQAWWRRVLGRRCLLKDPIAIFSAEWMAQTFPMDVVVLIRHPAAFVSSIKRMNWRFGFHQLLGQPALIERDLHPFESQMRQCRRLQEDKALDIIDEAILFWNVFHHVIERYRRDHPDWQFVRHEDLSLRPVEEFTRLLGCMDLTMTRGVHRAIATHTGAENPAEAGLREIHRLKRNSKANIVNWATRLTPAEIVKVRRATEAIAQHFYTDADWTSRARSAA